MKIEMETGAYTFKIVTIHKVHGLPWPRKRHFLPRMGMATSADVVNESHFQRSMAPASSKGRGRGRGKGRKRGEKEENKSHPLGLKLI